MGKASEKSEVQVREGNEIYLGFSFAPRNLARNKLLHGLFGVEGENHLLQVRGESCSRRSELGCPPGALLLLLFSLLRAESTQVKAQLHAAHRQVKVDQQQKSWSQNPQLFS